MEEKAAAASGREQASLDALEAATRDQKPAAFIVEPLILGAGGMLMYPAWVLKEMKRICEAAGRSKFSTIGGSL